MSLSIQNSLAEALSPVNTGTRVAEYQRSSSFTAASYSKQTEGMLFLIASHIYSRLKVFAKAS